VTAAAGCFYLAGRVMYAHGYYTGGKYLYLFSIFNIYTAKGYVHLNGYPFVALIFVYCVD